MRKLCRSGIDIAPLALGGNVFGWTLEYQEVSLSEWLVRTPPALVAQHFNIDPSVPARFPQNAPGILPA